MTDKCPACDRLMLFLSAWWYCEVCGWADRDELKERIRQELANNPEG